MSTQKHIPHQECNIYKVRVTTKNKIKQYIGRMGGQFKIRLYGHVRDFKVHKKNGTKLSKYIWRLKNSKNDYKIKWDILQCIGEVKTSQRICLTCTYENMEIETTDRGPY